MKDASHFHLGYRPALDGLRGVAILIVMCLHYNIPGFHGGILGVDMFFVLSGFLITTLLIEEWSRSGGISIKNFYIRRAIRLLPALALFLLVLGPFTPRLYLFSVITYWANWVDALQLSPGMIRPIGHLWSLSVEEQFYLLWPAFLLILLRNKIRLSIILWILAVFALIMYLRGIQLFLNLAAVVRIERGSDARPIGLLIGSLLAVAINLGALPDWGKWRNIINLVSLAAALSLPAMISTLYLFSHMAELVFFGFPGTSIATAILIARLVVYPRSAFSTLLEFKPLVAIGKVSYGLYLWHYPIGTFLQAAGVSSVLLKVVLSLLITFLSYRYIERPALGLKSRISSNMQTYAHQ